jgi:hypothetical protein
VKQPEEKKRGKKKKALRIIPPSPSPPDKEAKKPSLILLLSSLSHPHPQANITRFFSQAPRPSQQNFFTETPFYSQAKTSHLQKYLPFSHALQSLQTPSPPLSQATKMSIVDEIRSGNFSLYGQW